jgi:hypothetical protein
MTFNDNEASMKQPEEMELDDIRAELRRMGVTDRLVTLILREMAATEERIAKSAGRGAKEKYDPVRAQLFVLKANGMTNPDLSLNRKGKLFIALATREERERAA